MREALLPGMKHRPPRWSPVVARLALPFLLLAPLAGCAHAPPAAPAALSKADGDAAWSALSHLPGRWALERAPADSGKPPFVVSYALISNGSALVERWGEGSAHETATVFHRDHVDVLLTHYCAQGNQPRLRAAEVHGGTVVFRFADVTDRDLGEAMLVERTLSIAPNAVEDTEVYRGAGGADERTVYRFHRADAHEP